MDKQEEIKLLKERLKELENDSQEESKPKRSKKAPNYEKKSIITTYPPKDIPYYTCLGYTLALDSVHKDKSHRLIFQRDINSEFYPIWQKNEWLVKMQTPLHKKVSGINALASNYICTYKEIAQMPKYRLNNSMKQLLDIRPAEQKDEIKRIVNEVNNAYAKLSKETYKFYHTVLYIDDRLANELKDNPNVISKDYDYILQMCEKYKLEIKGDEVISTFGYFKYDFEKKEIVIVTTTAH